MYNDGTKLIVMLTHNDRTVENAYEIFDQCLNNRTQYWGLKEEGLTLEKMKELCAFMRANGKIAVLEVVAYSENDCMRGAEMAAECGCEILMGTMFFDSVNEYCKKHNIKYMPFVGKVKNRPSVLEGTVEEMITEAKEYLTKGVFGFDLLGYRYNGDSVELIEKFLSAIDAPVCVAGSINSSAKVIDIKRAGAWAFTIGGAFFENKFCGKFSEQIDNVYKLLENIV